MFPSCLRTACRRCAVPVLAALTIMIAACVVLPGSKLMTKAFAAESPQSDVVQSNVALVRRFLTEVVNGGHFELIDDLWARDMVWRSSGMGEVHGIDAYKKMISADVGKAFTQMHLDIKDIIASGDKVVVRFTNSGLNSGSFGGRPVSNRRAVWDGIGIYRIADGRIAEAWFTEDMSSMFAQLFPEKTGP